MSLNRDEQSLYDYLTAEPDECRHWQQKVAGQASRPALPGELARALERDLWDYFVERTGQVPRLRALHTGGLRRVSFLNLAEYLLRRWGPPPKPKPPRPAAF